MRPTSRVTSGTTFPRTARPGPHSTEMRKPSGGDGCGRGRVADRAMALPQAQGLISAQPGKSAVVLPPIQRGVLEPRSRAGSRAPPDHEPWVDDEVEFVDGAVGDLVEQE